MCHKFYYKLFALLYTILYSTCLKIYNNPFVLLRECFCYIPMFCLKNEFPTKHQISVGTSPSTHFATNINHLQMMLTRARRKVSVLSKTHLALHKTLCKYTFQANTHNLTFSDIAEERMFKLSGYKLDNFGWLKSIEP